MRKFYRLIILFFIALFSANVIAADYGKGIMTPLPHEKLSQPISLTKSCKKIRVTEWRSTRGYLDSTSKSKKSIKVLNDACNLAVNSFPGFINSKGYHIKKDVRQINVSVSLIPARQHRDGLLPRSLNDVTYRFAFRTKEYDPYGRLYTLWGYHQRATDYIYVRNDVLTDDAKYKNRDFVVVFVHELFHVMNYRSGVFHQHPAANRENIEEDMAQDFTEFLGLGR